MVTSTGEHLTVNNHRYPDLFWALRGGGGGTYGVITSVTYRTYESLPVAIYVFNANVTDAAIMKELLANFLQFQTNLTDDGWAAYGSLGNGTIGFFAVVPNMTAGAANASTQAWTDYAATSQNVSSEASIQTYPSYYEFSMSLFNTSGGLGGNAMMGSRLLSRDTLAKRSQDVAEILVDCEASFKCARAYFIHLSWPMILHSMVAGGKVSQIDPNSAGVNPAWRNAVVSVMCYIGWDEGASSVEVKGLISQLKTWISALNVVAPNDGAYFNEVGSAFINSTFPHLLTLLNFMLIRRPCSR